MTAASQPSLSAAARRAVDRTRALLFEPFDLGRWLAIGFGAWLASLGEGGWVGGGGGGNGVGNPGNRRGAFRGGIDDLQGLVSGAADYFAENLLWLIPTVLLGLVVVGALLALVLWLSSRGQFMFLHQVSTGRTDIGEAWSTRATQADRLFLFRLVLTLPALLVLAPLGLVGTWSLASMATRDAWGAPGILLAVACLGAALLTGAALFLIDKLTRDFVVPVMYLRGIACVPAWQEFRGLLRAHLGDLLLYLAAALVLHVAAAVIVVLLVLVTCCVAGCFLALPYLGTVFLLPLHLFFRAFSAAFLAELAPGWDSLALLPPAPSTGPAHP